MTSEIRPRDVLDFWFAAGPQKWWRKDEEFDADIKKRFGDTLRAARKGQLENWRDGPEGALALVIVLDQFSRNVYRNDPRAFAHDRQSLETALSAIDRTWDMELPAQARQWFYLPLMHAEDLGMQERCIELCKRSELEGNLEAAIEHADIIRRFGRFPHRNAVLGRVSTQEEIRFLEDGGFAG